MHPAAFVFEGLARTNRLHTVVFSGANRAITANQTVTLRLMRGTILSLDTVSFAPLYGFAPIIGWSTTRDSATDPNATAEYALDEAITLVADMTLYPVYQETNIPASGGTWDGAGWCVADKGFTFISSSGSDYCVNNSYSDSTSFSRSGKVVHSINHNTGTYGSNFAKLVLNPSADIPGFKEETVAGELMYGQTSGGSNTTRTFTIAKFTDRPSGDNVGSFNVGSRPSSGTSQNYSTAIFKNLTPGSTQWQWSISSNSNQYIHALLTMTNWIIR